MMVLAWSSLFTVISLMVNSFWAIYSVVVNLRFSLMSENSLILISFSALKNSIYWVRLDRTFSWSTMWTLLKASIWPRRLNLMSSLSMVSWALSLSLWSIKVLLVFSRSAAILFLVEDNRELKYSSWSSSYYCNSVLILRFSV